MTSAADRNDLQCPLKEKLEWVTPKISLMDAGDTEGSTKANLGIENVFVAPNTGPS